MTVQTLAPVVRPQSLEQAGMIDIHAIEYQARSLRAEAMREFIVALKAAFARLTTRSHPQQGAFA